MNAAAVPAGAPTLEAAGSAALRTVWLRDAAAVAAAVPAWRALWLRDTQADLFAGPDWLAWLLERFGGTGGPAGLAWHDGPAFQPIATGPWQPCMATVVDAGGALRAVLPLVQAQGRLAGRTRALLASPLNFHAPRSGLTAVGFDAATAACLARAIASLPGWQLLLLDGLPAADGRAALLLEALRAHGLALQAATRWPSAALQFNGSLAQYLAGPDRAHFRRSLVKARHGLAKLGTPAWQCLQGEAALAEGLPAFFAIDAASWKATGGESVGRDPDLRGHYAALCQRLAASGALEVWLLRLDGRPIAGFLCPHLRGLRYTLKSSFVDDLAGNRSPSLVLLHDLVQQAWQGEARGIDFVGKVAFLDRWASDDLWFHTALWWRDPAALRWHRVAHRLAAGWRALRRRCRPWPAGGR